MTKKFSLSALTFMIIFLLSCEEKPTIPILTTNAATEITTTSAVSGGVITNDGGAPVISKGTCWNTSDDPTIDNNKTIETGESNSFTSNLTGLSPKTLYYVRAYATNSAGTGYGESISFTTLGDTPASVATNATNIAIDSAILNGSVNPNSLSTTVSFEWGTTTDYGNSVAANQSPVTGDTSINVSVKLTDLSPGTTYHFRIKAENSLGITYSSDMTFSTLGDVPAVTTMDITNLHTHTASLNGSVNPNYLSTSVKFEWGTTTSYDSTTTVQQSPLTGNSDVNVNIDLSGLSPGTTYHYRIVATNELGTTYGNDMTFKTLGDVPAVTILDITNLQTHAATLNCSVNPNYLSTSVTFEWGTTTSYDNTTAAPQSLLTGNSDVSVYIDLSGLSPGTTYHYRIVATNELGTTNSEDITFKTLGQVPFIVPHTPIVKIDSAILYSSVNPNYLSTEVIFEWGLTNIYGNTISPTDSPFIGSSLVNTCTVLSGLSAETTYHFRIKATNELGTTYSEDSTFSTYSLVDADNNYYHSVVIGTQTWMNENLKTTRFTNGDLIGTTTPSTFDITNESAPKYQWSPNGNDDNKIIYGKLYTWFTVNDNRQICPSGWHVPSNTEWTTLVDFIGGESNGGSKLKETGILHWESPNADATDEYRFTALPAGYRTCYGLFTGFKTSAYFWTSTEKDITEAFLRSTWSEISSMSDGSIGKCYGFSLRCIKN